MGRTNIDIDDELVARTMERYGITTKREAVNFALRRLVGEHKTREQIREEVRAMEGMGWGGDLDEMRGEFRPG